MTPLQATGHLGTNGQRLHSQSQNVDGGIMIAVEDKTTKRAIVDPIGQLLFDKLSASRAHFTRVARIDIHYLPGGAFCLLGGELHELSPSNVSNRFPDSFPSILSHLLDVEFLKYDDLVLIDQAAREFVGKVLSFICDFLMKMNNLFSLLGSVWSALLCLAQSPLHLHKPGFVSPEKPGVVNLLARRKRGEGNEAHVDADYRIYDGQNLRKDLAREAGVPFVAYSSDRQCLDRPFDLPMFPDSHGADLGKPEPIFDKGKSALWEGETVVSIKASEPRVSGLLSCPYSAKEGSEGKINTKQCVLKALGIGGVKKRFFCFPLGQQIRRIVSGNRFFLFFPRLLSDFQRLVISPSAGVKSGLERFYLFLGRTKAKLICLTHVYMIYLFCVKSKSRFIPAAS